MSLSARSVPAFNWPSSSNSTFMSIAVVRARRAAASPTADRPRRANRHTGDTMQFRRLGTSGLEVSIICLGTMMFGDRTTEADAREIVAAARDADVNFIDTADVYANGAAETITGAAIRNGRP